MFSLSLLIHIVYHKNRVLSSPKEFNFDGRVGESSLFSKNSRFLLDKGVFSWYTYNVAPNSGIGEMLEDVGATGTGDDMIFHLE
jgi:hypothetical protein